jgi:FixJ family two-component response regulator
MDMLSSSAHCHEAKSRVFAATPIVFVIDDDPSARESLQALIESEGWQPQTFRSGREFLSRPRVLVPSCLVLDIVLPDLNGLEVMSRVADRVDMPVIFVAGHCDVSTTVRAMKAGAAEVLTKPVLEDELAAVLRNAIDCSRAALGQAAKMRALRDCYASLSRREREVMALVVAGLMNKQVGAELGISEITVKAHRGKMMRKMLARSLPELVNMAAKLGHIN